VIANSTGPLHLAVAAGTDVIGFFPPIIPASSRRWGPYGKEESALAPDVPQCKRCSGQECAHWNCMELIRVKDVWQLVMKKLRNGE